MRSRKMLSWVSTMLLLPEPGPPTSRIFVRHPSGLAGTRFMIASLKLAPVLWSRAVGGKPTRRRMNKCVPGVVDKVGVEGGLVDVVDPHYEGGIEKMQEHGAVALTSFCPGFFL